MVPRKLRVPPFMILDEDGYPLAPCGLQTAGEQLTFIFSNGGTVTATLFDYLAHVDTDLGLQSTVEYVGKTANPATRPTDLEHRGLLETAYKTNHMHEEIVILFNTFHIRATAATEQLTVMTSNSLINQLHVRPEAEFIESLLIDYFEPEEQRCSLTDTRGRLRSLAESARTRGVRTVDLIYEVDAESDIYRIGSRRVRASRVHHIQRDLRSSGSHDL
jgi:hypothetical protein